MSNISPEMKAAIGTQISRRVSYPMTAADIRKWALAVYWPDAPPSRYLSTDNESLVAPEEINPFAWAVVKQEQHPAAAGVDANDPDRTEKQIGVTGPGLKFQLNGGVSTEYGEPIRVGDIITSVTTLGEYSEREGRLGKMLISSTPEVWTNQRGEFVKRVEITLIRY